MTKQVKKVKAEATAQVDLSAYTTTSAKIRALHASGMSRGDIAKLLGKRYQHVRNVLITPIKRTEA